MKIKVLQSFVFDLDDQVAYIAQDKPKAARKFKKDILLKLKDLKTFPYKNKRSIYFDSEHVRDLVFKGYAIVYLIKPNEKRVEVFGLIKYKEKF